MRGFPERPLPRSAKYELGQEHTLTRRAWLSTALAAAVSLSGAGAPPPTAFAGPARPRTLDSAGPQLTSGPGDYLDRVVLLCDFPVREEGESSWPQGLSINKLARKIYVSNQKGPHLRIDVRTFPSGVRESSRTIATDEQCWTEGLPWFYNQQGHLCFIIRATRGEDTYASTYAIYNYTAGVKSANIPILGAWRADVSGRYLATTDAGARTVSNFFVYDWASVRAGRPRLLRTVPAQRGIKTAAKNQGLAWVGSHLYLIQGGQSESPTFQAWDNAGRLVLSRKYGRADFRDLVNKIKPGYLSNASYTYEAEGAYSLDGKLVSVQIVNNNPAVTKDGRVLVLQHHRSDGVLGRMRGA